MKQSLSRKTLNLGRKSLLSIVIGLLVSTSAWSTNKVTQLPTRKTSLPKEIRWAAVIDKSVKIANYDQLFSSAFGLISYAYRDQTDIKQLEPVNGKIDYSKADFVIIIASQEHLQSEIDAARSLGFNINEADAFSIMPDGATPIINILYDRISFVERNGQLYESPTAFSGLIHSLGHELFGNVIPFLYGNPFPKGEPNKIWQFRAEVRAYTEGIKVAEKILAMEDFALPNSTREGLISLINRDRERLRQWTQALNQATSGSVEKLSNKCQGLLKDN